MKLTREESLAVRAVFVLACMCAMTGAIGQTVYRLGNSYSDEGPGTPVDVRPNSIETPHYPAVRWADYAPRQPRVHRPAPTAPTVINNITVNNQEPQSWVPYQGAQNGKFRHR